MTQHKFTWHAVAYGATRTSDQYHLAFRQLEGEDRLVGLNDGNPGSDWFVPFKGSDGSTMPLDQSPGWHHLTIVSDVGAKRSTLYVDGNKWGDAAGAAVLGF